MRIKGTDIPLASLIDPNEQALWFTWVQVNRPGAEEYVKGYIQYYADMGVRFLRVDFLSWFEDGFDKNLGRVGSERPRADYEKSLRWMKEACEANDMFLSLVMPHLDNEAELEVRYGHMFRINENVATGGWGRFNNFDRGIRHSWWSQWYNTFDGFAYWSYLAGRDRIILDGDFLRANTFATDDERKTAISLGLIAGGPIAVADQHNTVGGHLWVYQNRELLALNEDGFVGAPLSNDPTDERSQIWKGQLSNGDWIVGLFNREDQPRTRSIRFEQDLGLAGRMAVRDLWAHVDLGSLTEYSATVPPHGCVVLQVGSHFLNLPPTITTQPSSQSVNVGASVSFSVAATGIAPLAYQWHFNSSPITGATSDIYTITRTSNANAGSYHVVVSHASGSVTSNTATLTVSTPQPQPAPSAPSGGGGGGAPSLWLCAALAVLGVARHFNRRT